MTICVYDHNKLFLSENGYYGVVGYSHKKMHCYICPQYPLRCAHVRFVEDNISVNNPRYPAITVFHDRKGKERKANKRMKCYSTAKIPYKSCADYAQKLNARPEELFHTVDNMHVAGVSVTCDCDLPDMIATSSEVPAVFRDRMCNVTGKYQLFPEVITIRHFTPLLDIKHFK